MKIRYDAEADVVYIRLSDSQILETEETETGMLVDLDAEGKVVGLEFLNARDFFSPKVMQQFEKAA